MKFLVVLLIGLPMATAAQLPGKFKKLMKRADMVFTTPPGYTKIKPIANRQMNYEFALKKSGLRFEVRFAVRPLDKMLAEYTAWKKNPPEGSSHVDPNNLFRTLFQVTLMNICGGQLMTPDISVFEEEAVNREFNADWGATAVVQPGTEFGQEYKWCLAVALHRDNLGDAYIFYLADETSVLDELFMESFHAIRFRPTLPLKP